jgi:hypothetical protein
VSGGHVEHDEHWADLANDIHAVLGFRLGGRPDFGDTGLCHDVADAVIAAGWQLPEEAPSST